MGDGVAVLEARGLTKRYPFGGTTVDAIRGVDFRIEQGEFVAFMGPSGCGKSTLIHLVGGLIAPTEGTLLLDNKDLTTLSDRRLSEVRRNRIGLVFQFHNLIPNLNALENIGLPLLLSGQSLEAAEDRLLDLAELFGLRGREQHRPSTLSAGEQQRVAIARAVVMRPAIVVADEPTGNLDYVNGREILQLLWEACVNFGQTVLLSTHDVHSAKYADRVYFLRDGTIVGEVELGRREEHHDAGPVISRLQELGL